MLATLLAAAANVPTTAITVLSRTKPSPMNVRISMCPASMFAKSRTESEIRRMNWPRISSGTISGSIAFGTSGIQLLKYRRGPL